MSTELSTKSKAAIVVELVRAGKLMFNRPPLSDAELETLAWKCLENVSPSDSARGLEATVTTGGSTICRRCGRSVLDDRQLCGERTPASPYCWTQQLQENELEVPGGLRLRGGNYPPLAQLPDDPYG